MRDEPSQPSGANEAASVVEFGAGPVGTVPLASQTRGRRRRRTDWRIGGRAIGRWDYRVLVGALFGAGAGTLVSVALAHDPRSVLGALSLPALWAGLLASVAYAIVRGRPAGLFRLKPIDVIWGVGLGLGMRLLQGAMSDANDAPFPVTDATAMDSTGIGLAAGVAGPMVEELYFRAVLLVIIFQMLRKSLGMTAAGATALLASSGSFVILHAVFGSLLLADALQLFLVGAACSLLVLLTGRVWGAVILHVVYNIVLIVIMAVGAAGA